MLAAAGLMAVGVTSTVETRSASALPMLMLAQGTSGKCTVDVVRTAAPRTAVVTRLEPQGGDCICKIVTGPEANNGSAESTVFALLRDRECGGASVVAKNGSGETVLVGLLSALAAGGGLVVALGNDSKG